MKTQSEQNKKDRVSKGKRLRGVVASTAMDKTVIVEVERYVKHAKYLKYQKRRKRYAAHDENNELVVGDKVLLQEVRPISKRKTFIATKAS